MFMGLSMPPEVREKRRQYQEVVSSRRAAVGLLHDYRHFKSSSSIGIKKSED